MIRINLLGVQRQVARKTASFSFLDPNQRATFACCAIFGATALGIGGWYWSLSSRAAALDTEIAAAQAEVTRLNKVLVEVKRAEERRGQLQQRVAIIEELRRDQSVPVQMLDHVSRSMPDFLWLTALEQKVDDVTIEGRTTTLISLADFVANLGNNRRLVEKPIDIINSQVEGNSGSGAAQGDEVIKFSVKAPMARPGAPKGGAPGTATGVAPGQPPAGAR
jgi:type IV pilus assembly protein PilN